MTMEESITNEELANLDLSKFAALQQKRTLAFANHFVITTVKFLNAFMKKCEQKLMHFERRLEKVNAAMVLLEAKLSSIPELNIPSNDAKEVSENTTETMHNEKPAEYNVEETPDKAVSKENNENPKDTTQISPEYERFMKMVQVGVPLEAVKLKVTLEGLDPNVLEKLLK